MNRIVLVSVLIAVVIGGCGGSDENAEPSEANFDVLISCIGREFPDADIATSGNRVAGIGTRGAGVGVADVELEHQDIAVGVDRSVSDAEDTLRTAQFTEGEENAEQHGVVVVAYDNTPTTAEKAAINRCVAAAAE
jgi:hypothetical protein